MGRLVEAVGRRLGAAVPGRRPVSAEQPTRPDAARSASASSEHQRGPASANRLGICRTTHAEPLPVAPSTAASGTAGRTPGVHAVVPAGVARPGDFLAPEVLPQASLPPRRPARSALRLEPESPRRGAGPEVVRRADHADHEPQRHPVLLAAEHVHALLGAPERRPDVVAGRDARGEQEHAIDRVDREQVARRPAPPRSRRCGRPRPRAGPVRAILRSRIARREPRALGLGVGRCRSGRAGAGGNRATTGRRSSRPVRPRACWMRPARSSSPCRSPAPSSTQTSGRDRGAGRLRGRVGPADAVGAVFVLIDCGALAARRRARSGTG